MLKLQKIRLIFISIFIAYSPLSIADEIILECLTDEEISFSDEKYILLSTEESINKGKEKYLVFIKNENITINNLKFKNYSYENNFTGNEEGVVEKDEFLLSGYYKYESGTLENKSNSYIFSSANFKIYRQSGEFYYSTVKYISNIKSSLFQKYNKKRMESAYVWITSKGLCKRTSLKRIF